MITIKLSTQTETHVVETTEVHSKYVRKGTELRTDTEVYLISKHTDDPLVDNTYEWAEVINDQGVVVFEINGYDK